MVRRYFGGNKYIFAERFACPATSTAGHSFQNTLLPPDIHAFVHTYLEGSATSWLLHHQILQNIL